MNPDSSTSTHLQWIGHSAASLENCQGDCDNDNNCNGDLICWQRGSTDSDPIPGCTGDILAIDTANSDPGIDYCYDPTAGILCLLFSRFVYETALLLLMFLILQTLNR